MTVPTCEATNLDYLARRAAGYNMPGEVVDGMDVLAVWDAVGRAAERARRENVPTLLDCVTFRIRGHSLSDDRRSYRSRDEEEHWLDQECIGMFARKLVEAGVLKEAEVERMRGAAEGAVEAAIDFAIEAPYPEASSLMEDVFADTTSDSIPADLATKDLAAPCEPFKRDADGTLLFGEALNEGIREEMLRDRRVVLYGEDIAAYGGAFGATRGLHGIFGPERVWNTAISEACIVGSGIGAAMCGLRPVVELMYIDFTGLAMDQIANQAAKIRYMFGGKCKVPMVIRTPIGGGRGYAGQHSQSLESWFMHVPGLRLVVPSTPYDVKGLIKTAIRDDNPVLFVEHQLLYSGKQYRGPVPEEEYTIPMGVADVKRPGKDVTIVAYSRMVHVSLAAAAKLAEEGIEAEVVDPRTLVPLDMDTILASVQKTGRVVVVAQCPITGSSTAEITAQIQEQGFDYLDAPIQRVAAPDCTSPMSPVLEKAYLPDEDKIIAAVKRIL
jgi:2-oxoisovalerate dehydrogenase E1 component